MKVGALFSKSLVFLFASISLPGSVYPFKPQPEPPADSLQPVAPIRAADIPKVAPSGALQRTPAQLSASSRPIIRKAEPGQIRIAPGQFSALKIYGEHLNVPEAKVLFISENNKSTAFLRGRLRPEHDGKSASVEFGAANRALFGSYRAVILIGSRELAVPAEIVIARPRVPAASSRARTEVDPAVISREAARGSTALAVPKQIVEGPAVQLQMKKLGGDLTEWVDEWAIDSPADKPTFRFKALRGDIQWVEWQVSEEPFPPAHGRQSGIELSRWGRVGSRPVTGGWVQFDVDFGVVVPVPPPDRATAYYLRVQGKKRGGPGDPEPFVDVGPPSAPVIVHYTPPAEPTRFTTKGLYPELWRPMPVSISLGPLHILRAQEEDDEEPYVIVVLIFADGNTVKLLQMGQSSVRIMATQRTHGNVWDDGDLGSGDNPHILERFPDTTILPIGLDVLELLESLETTVGSIPSHQTLMKNTSVFLLAIAMEEDETRTSDADKLRDTLVDSLESEVNAAIRRIDIGVNTDTAALQDQFSAQMDEIIKNVMGALKSEIADIKKDIILSLPFRLLEAADPDDRIGEAFDYFTYQEILDAGPAGTTRRLDFMRCDDGDCDTHYTLDIGMTKLDR